MGTAMAQSIIYLSGDTKKKLMQKAKVKGTSFAEEVRKAVDIYIDFGEDIEVSRAELEVLLAEARTSINGMIKSVDRAIKKSDEALKRMETRERGR